MLKVRLQRVGRRNDPSFRIVVIESTKGPKSRNYIEMLGSYNARLKKTEIKDDRVKHWISQGAQVSDTVHNLLISNKIIEGEKVNPLPKKAPIVGEAAAEPQADSAETAATPEASDEKKEEEVAASEESVGEESEKKEEETTTNDTEEEPKEEKDAEEETTKE